MCGFVLRLLRALLPVLKGWAGWLDEVCAAVVTVFRGLSSGRPACGRPQIVLWLGILGPAKR
jgi:hypothetical protein